MNAMESFLKWAVRYTAERPGLAWEAATRIRAEEERAEVRAAIRSLWERPQPAE